MFGQIDFHSHVLPQMGDGSDGVETSLALLRELSAQGMTTVCATSHYYLKQDIEHYIVRQTAALRSLSELWSSNLPTLMPGAEIFSSRGSRKKMSCPGYAWVAPGRC